jgi:hypothetical protein
LSHLSCASALVEILASDFGPGLGTRPAFFLIERVSGTLRRQAHRSTGTMNDQIRYYRFVARFVDAVVGEPLLRTFRERRTKPIPLRAKAPRVLHDAPLPIAA